MLGAVHLHPAITIPAAVLLAALGVWQMRRAVRPGTPRSRTWIRGTSMVVRLVMLVPFVLGLSFVDPGLAPGRYLLVWAVAMALLGLSFMITAADIINNVRVAQHDWQRLQPPSRDD